MGLQIKWVWWEDNRKKGLPSANDTNFEVLFHVWRKEREKEGFGAKRVTTVVNLTMMERPKN
jgi:hypothetical protein